LSNVRIQLSSCFFQIEIEGEAAIFVDEKGFSGKVLNSFSIEQEKLRVLVESFFVNGFFDFQNSYTSEVSDSCITRITYSYNGFSKVVEENYGGAPDGFREIYNLIIETVGVEDRIEQIFWHIGP
jgi:hypothetical protein